MFRRYLMSGFAVAVLAFFASARQPASRPDASAGSGIKEGRQSSASVQQKRKPSQMPQPFGANKLVYSSEDVCRLSLARMYEKLDEADLPNGTQKPGSGASGPSSRTVEAMIALVPDPIHTHLALRFDRTVDTIQQALQDTPNGKPGWVYTSQWLPWDPVPYQAAEDSIDRMNIRTFDRGSECAPGLLIFHDFQAKDPSRFLVVLLVGESPTSGINQKQFQNALAEWSRIERNPTGKSKAPTLQILGPSFSTSLFNLNRLLHENWCPGLPNCIQTAKVISGTVSAEPTRVNHDFPYLKKAEYLSLSESAASRRDMVLNYLQSGGVHLNSVALLSEDQTPYGNFSGSMDESVSKGKEEPKDEERPIIFHFPREISQLRNAYEENSILSASSSSRDPNAPNQALKLSLEDRHEQEDDIPSFSSKQNSISEESILSAITRTMESQGIRVVVISATDMLDEMFVARFLSRDLPDARIILTESDQILLRRDNSHNFRGMLTVTSYPLIQDDAGWGGRFLTGTPGEYLPDRVFPSMDMVGIYDAMRLLAPLATASTDPTEEVCAGDNHSGCRWLSGYEDPFLGGNQPPLWLSAIGRNGFWPVALLDHLSPGASTVPPFFEGNKSVDATSCKSKGTIPPAMFPSVSEQRLAASSIVLVGILFGIIFCVFASPVRRWPEYHFDVPNTDKADAALSGAPSPAAPASMAAACRAPKSGTNSEKRAWIVFSIILCYSWIARLLILDLPWTEFWHNWANWILLGGEIVLFIFAIWLIRTALYREQRPFWAGLLLVLTIGAQVAFHWVILPKDFAERIFYLYRSDHLLSGVSPMMPFICLFAAFICIVSRHIQALLVFSPDWMPRVPCYQDPQGAKVPGSLDEREIDDIFGACRSSWRLAHEKLSSKSEKSRLLRGLLLCPVILLVVVICKLASTGFQTFETPHYSIALTILSLFIGLFLLYEILWVAIIWGRLNHGLLVPLERSPLRVCFSRVAGFSWRRLWLSLDLSLISRYKPLSRAHESVEHLQTRGCPLEVLNAADIVCKSFQAMHDAIRKPNPNPSTLLQHLGAYQSALKKCADAVIASMLYKESPARGPLATRYDASAEAVNAALESAISDDPLRASAEEFVGLIYIHAIQHVLIDIRSHIFAFVAGYMFLILALNVYPVGPHHTVTVLLTVIFAVFVIVVLLVFMQMHRDTILSRTTNTESGKLGFDFYEKLIPVIGVPLIGLLASLFPEISNFLFSWLQPSLQAIK